VVLALLLLTLGAAIFVTAQFFLLFPTWWPLWIVVSLGLTISVLTQYAAAEERLLKTAGASVVHESDEPELCHLVERLAAMFDLPGRPAVAVASNRIPNVFAVGKTHGRSIVVITDEMRSALDTEELEAVVAHELSHIANRDAAVMTIASVPRMLGLQLFAAETGIVLWFFLWPLGFVLYAWSSFLIFALSRYREYTADAGAAVATGRPETLMSALQKLTGEIGAIPRKDLRAVAGLNPLFIVPVARREGRFEFLMDHPRLESRLAHLASVARGMGKAVH
jgi:heat shock protein HtpX